MSGNDIRPGIGQLKKTGWQERARKAAGKGKRGSRKMQEGQQERARGTALPSV